MSSNNQTISSDNINNNDGLLVCFVKLEVPNILHFRVLSELIQQRFNEIESKF